MKGEILSFLRHVSLKNSESKARKMVAEHFGGSLTSSGRYVKIGETEYKIEKNADIGCGWIVREMKWGVGNDWRFYKAY